MSHQKDNIGQLKKWSTVCAVILFALISLDLIIKTIAIYSLRTAFIEKKTDTLTFIDTEHFRKRGAMLVFRSGENKPIKLSCTTPGSGGLHDCPLNRTPDQGENLSISWVEIPDGITSSINYPTSIIDNKGNRLIHPTTEDSLQKRCRNLLLYSIITSCILILFFGFYYFWLVKTLHKRGVK